MNINKKILLLTLVHPDFLPPVYAVGQVLRDLGFTIHILTFDSFVPAELDLGSHIIVEAMGKHHAAGTIERMRMRQRFTQRARQIVSEEPLAIISFCPFSFNCALKIKKNLPVAYIVLEIADFLLPEFLHSPLSHYRNLRALRNIPKADFVATPSYQRSAWLAGRRHLNYMPYTILNTAYLPARHEENTWETYKAMMPAGLVDKKVILYTGAVNEKHCIVELVQAFGLVNDAGSALVITGVKENEYGNRLKTEVEKNPAAGRIVLLPYITRPQMLALQANAHIGACLTRAREDNVEAHMIAPNKVGEYLFRNLYILGIKNEYMQPLEMKGIASLSETPAPPQISKAITEALAAVDREDVKTDIMHFVEEYFSMQQQLKPLIQFLNERFALN